jgi:two-component system, NarL family, sensor kinase
MALPPRSTVHRAGDRKPDDRKRLGTLLLRAQEEERRRLGGEIHDATAQLLVALDLSIIRLKSMPHDRAASKIFTEIRQILNQIHRELRTFSYALHPPLLEKGRLVEAIATLAGGFSARTGLRIAFRPEQQSWTLSKTVEETLYRLVQEALVNVHRHARASQVDIRLTGRRRGGLYLLVADDGVGVRVEDGPSVIGVGIAGMRARIRDLGGQFSVRQLTCGTVVAAALPRRATRA